MATPTAILAPNPRYLSLDKLGNPNADGEMYTYYDGTDVPAPTYKDPAMKVENENPVKFDAAGEAVIFWDSSHYYSTQEWTEGGKETGTFIRSNDRYPYVAAASGNINVYTPDNLIRNPQFTFWDNTTNFPGYGSIANNFEYVADEWLFTRSNLNATINLSQQVFAPGQVNVDGFPIYYFHYECTDIGAGAETFKKLFQVIQSVQTASGREVAVAIVAKSQTSSPITISILQQFGTGGSPSATVETVILSANLTPNWQRFTATFTLPSVAGKTLGTNDDDAIWYSINYPLNAIAQVDNCNAQFHITNTGAPPFPYLSQNEQFKRLDTQITYCLARTGDTKMSLRPVADPGWLLLDDGTIGNPSSNATHANNAVKALFFLLWQYAAQPSPYFPINTSAGVPTTAGASAEVDWDANKQIRLPISVGRVIANANGFTSIGNFVGEATHVLTIPEMPSHTHSIDVTFNGAATGGQGQPNGGGTPAFNTNATGGNAPHNNMQPTVFLNCMIKL